jgi:MFS family permease
VTAIPVDVPDRRQQRNLAAFYLYKVFYGLAMGIATPILVLYFLAKPLSLTWFMILLTVLNLAAFASSIPSGVVADRLSRKASMLFGAVGLTLSFILMFSTGNLFALLAAFLLWGVAQSFCVGVESAFLFDSVKALGREAGFQRVAGNSSFLFLGSTVAGNALSGFLVGRLGLSTTFSMAVVAIAFCIPTIAAFREPPLLHTVRIAEKTLGFRERLFLYRRHLADSIRLLLGNRGLLTIALVQIVIFRSFNLVNRPFAQPVLGGFGFSASAISFLFVGFNVASAASAKFAHLMDKEGTRESRSYVVMLALLLAFLALLAYSGSGAPAAVAIAGIHLVYGFAGPLLATGLNRRVESAQRATCLSIVTMAEAGLAMLTGPLFGGLSDATSLGTGLRILLWSFAPLIACAITLVVFVIRAATVGPTHPRALKRKPSSG